MSVSIEEAAYITIQSSYYYLHFEERYRDTLGPILYIPTYIRNLLFLAIDEKCAYGFSKITDVIITEGYLRIHRSAFANCPNLKSIQIPNSVYYIDSYAFENSNQTIITFTSGNNNITMLYEDTNVKAIIYYRTSIINFRNEMPSLIHINDANNITFEKYEKIWVSYPVPSTDVRPLAEIENGIISSPTKKSSATNKIIPSCQKSNSPLNLLLITQLIVKN